MDKVQTKNKEGIALVIVLGMLASLVIFGVAFSVSMRTERMATRAFLDVVRTRQLAHTAINRVLGEEIPQRMELLNRVYPELDVFTSAAAGGAGDLLPILADGTLDSPFVFVPRSLWVEAQLEGITTGVPWIPMLDAVDGTFQGEYAFIVVNNSGLLDANVIGERENLVTPRERGFDPGEIRFHASVLPEVQNAASLRLYRNAFRRFESVPELYYLTSSAGSAGDTDFLSAIGPLPTFHAGAGPGNPIRFVDNLHVFSRYPRGYAEVAPDGRWVANTNVAEIAGPPASWDLSLLDTTIQDIFPDATHRDMFINALYDYADESYIPHGTSPAEQFQRFSAKPVPMINEVIVSNSLTRIAMGLPTDPDMLQHRTHITIETWFPFPADPDNTPFTIELGNVETTGWFPPYTQFQTPGTMTGPEPASFIPDPNTPQLTRFTILHEQSIMYEGPPSPPALPYPFQDFGDDFIVRVNIEEIRVMQGGQPVDIVFGPWPATALELAGVQNSLPPGALRGTGPGGNTRVAAYAANDPRLNWDPDDDLHWRDVGIDGMTPGAINSRVSAEEAEFGYNSDEVGFMYARRQPLASVGEVGFLLFDPTKPWTTVRLLNDSPDPRNMSRLLDRLTVHSNTVRRGMVNLNTRQTNALMAALYEMPVERYPDPSNIGDGLTIQQSQALTDAIQALGYNTPTYSEFVNSLQPAAIDAILALGDDKFLRESVIRNSLGVLGIRNNLFTVVVAARVYSDDYDYTSSDHQSNRDDYVMADQRAVAVVWRDPFRTQDSAGFSTYRTIMHYFLWESGAVEDD